MGRDSSASLHGLEEMKIRTKLMLGFSAIVVLVAVAGFISVFVSQRILRQHIEQESVAIANNLLRHIDRSIYSRIEQLQAYAQDLSRKPMLIRSNHEFEKLDNIQEYITARDLAWTTGDNGQTNTFMEDLISNELSAELRDEFELRRFYEERYGYAVYGEVFVTNKYGANAGQTGRTSDYYQADEQWWQKAKDDGLYVGDVEHDQSSNVNSITIAARLDSSDGEFLGIVKAVLDVAEIIRIIDTTAAEEGYAHLDFKLLTGDGRIIYCTEEFTPLESIPAELASLLQRKEGNREIFSSFITRGDIGTELYSHAHSEGYRSYRGLEWVLVLEQEVNDVFAPIARLRNLIVIASLLITSLAFALGVVISKSIAGPVGMLTKAIREMGKGDLSKRVVCDSHDEIGLLAGSFNAMLDELSETTASKRELMEEIDRRRATETNLREQERQSETLFRAAPYGLLLLDENLTIKKANDIALKLVNRTDSDVLEKTAGDGLGCVNACDSVNGCGHNSVCPQCVLRKSVEEVLCSGHAVRGAQLQYVFVIDGNKVNPWIEVTIEPLDIDNKKHVIVAVNNITDRKDAEAEREGLSRFPSEDPNPVLRISQDGKVLYSNEPGRPLLAEWKAEVGTRLPEKWCHLLTEALTFEQSMNAEEYVDHTVFSISIAPVKDAGYVNLYGRNITDLKNTINELKLARTEAEAANEAKGQFLANMSHEIRTPMNAIIGFGDLLADEGMTEKQRSYVDTIRNSGRHLLQVINDILDFSKIGAGKMEVETIRCSLAKVLNAVESIMHAKAAEKGVEFKIQNAEDVPANVKSDPNRLKQCLINLVGNAVKFTEEGHVHVNVSLEYNDAQPFIRFDVEDTGIGIPPARQTDIFESFTQADVSMSRKYGGTGLGLAITRKLTEAMGGELHLCSEEGKGSTFSLVIPAGVNVAAQPLLNMHPLDEIRGDDHGATHDQDELSGRVLVAEDVATNQILARLLLEKVGLKVSIAGDGKEAVEMALAEEFDLILMDMQMPNMNGYDASRLLKKEGLSVPIIALTAHAMKGDEAKCLEAGCDDYLPKPLDKTGLLAVLHKWLPSKTDASNDLLQANDSSTKLNCWEFKECGREPGGSRFSELGACPAATNTACDSINNGKNAGRYCWKVAGTTGSSNVKCSCAERLPTCIECDFYKQVQDELSSAFVL
jgi:signal transduction histidine kinase/FixJ family two-component response regulator/PAS domain-containing protein